MMPVRRLPALCHQGWRIKPDFISFLFLLAQKWFGGKAVPCAQTT
jgi:hypothetical protein